MKKIKFLVIILFTITCLTSCSTNIIPKGYVDLDTYTSQNIEQINNSLQYSIYVYDELPNMKNNKFLEKITQDDKDLLEVFLTDFEEEISEYDFYDKYIIDLDDIQDEDYIYIDYKEKEGLVEYFMIYYFDVSNNKLHYCYMMY